MNATILNREFEHPSDGWYQIEPKGEFPNAEAGVVQVLDDGALLAIANRFNLKAKTPGYPGMLIDHEHFRHQPDKETVAYGWLMEVQNRSDGLYGRIKWTRTGKEAVDGGDYRFFSTEYERVQVLNQVKPKRVKPLELTGLTLTNSPNNAGGKPITNREFRRGAGALPAGNETTNNESKSMKSVCVLLGLSADANEESVHTAVTKLMNRANEAEGALTPLKNRMAAVEAENVSLLEAQVESDLVTYAHCYAPAEKAATKELLLKNRAVILQAWKSVPKPEAKDKGTGAGAQTNIHNRGGTTPGSVSGNTSEGRDHEKQRAEVAHAEVEEYRLQNRCSYEQALENMRRKKPELFGLNRN